jgi:hypothetical protein
MATVDCRNGCRNDYDDDADDMLDDPLAVADTEHSDAVRAAEEGGDADLPASQHRQRRLHRVADVRRLQGVTLRNVSRRLGVPLELVRLGLESFSSGSGGSPGRFNLLDLEGASIVVDYGHNVPSLEQICATIRALPHVRRTAVYSAAGDRRDEDLFQQGKLLATTFDRVVIYEDAYIRGRQPGEITAIISRGIEAGMRAECPTTIQAGGTWCEAAALVLDSEVLLLQVRAASARPR